jgi:hypothetical protein
MSRPREGARSAHEVPLACPSAPPSIAGAVAFGVIDHSADQPEVLYLDQRLPVTPDLLELASPLEPTEVFRFGAPCQTDRCTHWSGNACGLVDRIVDLVPARALTTPPCALRATCRWYAQRGRSACVRCPEVLTRDGRPSAEMRAAATPRADREKA